MWRAAVHAGSGNRPRGQIRDHEGTGVAGNGAASVGGKGDTGQIDARIHQGKNPRANILRDIASAKKDFGIAIDADGRAARVAGNTIAVDVGRAENVRLAIAKEVESRTRVTGDFDGVVKRDLTIESRGHSYWTVVLDVGLGTKVEQGNFGILLQGHAAQLISADGIGAGKRSDLGPGSAEKLHTITVEIVRDGGKTVGCKTCLRRPDAGTVIVADVDGLAVPRAKLSVGVPKEVDSAPGVAIERGWPDDIGFGRGAKVQAVAGVAVACARVNDESLRLLDVDAVAGGTRDVQSVQVDAVGLANADFSIEGNVRLSIISADEQIRRAGYL